MSFTKSHTTLKILLCGAFVLVGLLSLSSNCLAQGYPWTTKSPMPTGRFWFSCEVVDGKIYAIGGATAAGAPTLATVEEYDPITDNWTTKQDMPTARCNMASAVVDGKIYIVGGDRIFQVGVAASERMLEVYDPATDTWDTTKTNMPTDREGVSGCVVNGIIYVVGGVAPGGVVLEVVEAYDPATDTWTTKAPMNTGRWALSTVVVDGKIYAMGTGQGGKTVEEYDPAMDTWTTKTSMLVGNGYFGTGIIDGIIYTIGGASGPDSNYSRVFAYDPLADEWSEKTAISTARGMLGAGVVNGKIYAIGGSTGWLPSPLSTNEEYDPHLDLLTLIEKIEIDKSYAKPGIDSVCISAKISDPTGITLLAEIVTLDQTPVDSLQLFDDGNHNDGNAGDSLYANVWQVSSVEERHHYVDLKVKRVAADTVIHYISNMATFTTIGPVEYTGYTTPTDFFCNKIIPIPGGCLNLKITLKNNSSVTTASNIKAELVSLDSLISFTQSSSDFQNIPAGNSSVSNNTFLISISEQCPPDTMIPIEVNISSYGHVCWRDTFSIMVRKETVNIENISEPVARIYPNPTDNMLNIEISNTGKQGLEIEIFSVTGKAIYRKEYRSINAHFIEQIDLSGYSKGIYLVKVRQPHAVYIGKVVVR